MPVSSFMGLETALRGLQAEQEAINTTGHNIANANTPGYSRQTAVRTESPALTIPAYSNVTGGGVQLGTGVDVTTINRIRNAFLDIQYRTQNSNQNQAQTQATLLDQVQTGLAEPGTNGLSKALSNFYSAWSGYANDPTSQANKQVVINDGQTVAETFNAIDQQLQTVQQQVGQQYTSLMAPTGPVALDATQIAQLNKSISQALAAGQSPNDLLDKRDQLIDDLSSLGNVTTSTDTQGMVTVQFGDAATPLVAGTTVNMPAPTALTSAAGGQIGALLGLYDANAVPTGSLQTNYRDVLDGIANQVVNAVNTAYQAGNAAAPVFFAGNSGSTIQVDPAISTATLQAGSNPANPLQADVATAISNLRGTGADQSYAAFVAQVGADVASAQTSQNTAQALQTAITNQRDSVSGVSLDEEMTNLVAFQRGYQASSRMMSTIDSMLDTLINHTGTVGL